MRYVWCPDGEPDAARGVSFAMNAVSRTAVVRRPSPVAWPEMPGKARGLAVRVDLRHYAARDRDYREMAEAWEELQFDPRFSLIVTPDAQKAASAAFPGLRVTGYVRREVWTPTDCEPYTRNGRTFTRYLKYGGVKNELAEIELGAQKDFEVIRLPAPHLDAAAWRQLCGMTGSESPLCSESYFLYRVLSAIEEKGLYRDVWGGLYYRMAGIPGTEKEYLASVGIPSLEDYAKRLADQRVAMFRSGVTGRPRMAEIVLAPNVRPDTGTGLMSITRDIAREDVDIGTHPVANLLKFKHRASEAINERPNGFHGYALFNAAGVRQQRVPPEIAKDHDVPRPHSGDLQPAISCISCHEAGGSDGWIEARNSVKKMLGKPGGLDVFADTSAGRLRREDLERIAQLYAGETERAFRRGRDDYAAAVLRATGPWAGSKSQADVVKLTGRRVVDSWRRYAYDMVTPRAALRELGIAVADDAAAGRLLADLLAPRRADAVPVPELGAAVVPEVYAVGALREGEPVDRFDWDLAYPYAAARAARGLADNRAGGKK